MVPGSVAAHLFECWTSTTNGSEVWFGVGRFQSASYDGSYQVQAQVRTLSPTASVSSWRETLTYFIQLFCFSLLPAKLEPPQPFGPHQCARSQDRTPKRRPGNSNWGFVQVWRNPTYRESAKRSNRLRRNRQLASGSRAIWNWLTVSSPETRHRCRRRQFQRRGKPLRSLGLRYELCMYPFLALAFPTSPPI